MEVMTQSRSEPANEVASRDGLLKFPPALHRAVRDEGDSFMKELDVPPSLADDRNGISIIHDEFVRRFDVELTWKDNLESKATSFLGFVGLFVAVLLAVSASPDSLESQRVAVLAAPLTMQVISALLLFFVVFGYSVKVGPALLEVVSTRTFPPDRIQLGLSFAYGEAILINRLALSRKVLWFQLGVLFAAGSLIQLSLGILAVAADPLHQSRFFWDGGWVLWLPGLAVVIAGTTLLVRDFARLVDRQREELMYWLRSGRTAGTDDVQRAGGEAPGAAKD